jgi:hypothetical protein
LWHSKKFIITAVVLAVLLLGTVATVAVAQTNSNDSSGKTLLARVAAILNIDQQKVEDAFAQARKEIRSDSLDTYLQKLIDEGKITQKQADQYKEWLQARPDMSDYNQALQDWQESKPDMPNIGGGLGGRLSRMFNNK